MCRPCGVRRHNTLTIHSQYTHNTHTIHYEYTHNLQCSDNKPQALHILCQEVDIRNSMKELNGVETLLKILSDKELEDLHEGKNTLIYEGVSSSDWLSEVR